MEEVLLRFGHIGEQIFEQLDSQAFTNCRMVSKSWQTFVDYERISAFQMIKFMVNLPDAYLKKFLIKINPDCCMKLAKCVYFIHDNYPKDHPNYQINPPKQLYIKAKLGWIDGSYKSYSSEVKFWDGKCHPKDYFGATLLHSAATDGNLQVYELITENALDKNPQNNIGITPLHLAAHYGHLEICQLIIENVQDKNPDSKRKWTPLHDAAMNGHFEICKLIIDNNQNKNPKDDSGDTPLHLAASYGKLQVFMLLLTNVIEKNPANIHGSTPLHHAAFNGNIEMYELIIGQIQDKNPKNGWGKTPLDYLHF